ncbi:hypothetical protein EW145_g2648 [Phellinidium pouzarii]|uniref:EXPERA domain-containing protein n=1 Tax=Phellinidium pouzarii TaxID=167371 RepID=A0A4S4LAL0_9AGAM|nr:hypothetical protein EW145_g2648 [Phellinidium pouzarii]
MASKALLDFQPTVPMKMDNAERAEIVSELVPRPPLRGDGSGVYRSTLTDELSSLLGVPAIHLDRLYWNPGWGETPNEAFQAKVCATIDVAEANVRGWVVDGNYDSKLSGQLDGATDIIWLDTPFLLYFPRILRRTFLRLLRLEPTCAPGCEERAREVFFSRQSILWWAMSNHAPFHIPATLLLDLQSLYPPALVPAALARLPELYVSFSSDPLIAGALGLNGPPSSWVWFKSFLVLEAVFQLPVFIIGMRGLWRDSRALYPLLLVYAASTTTTTLPCLTTVLFAPSAPTTGPTLALTPEQRALLLASYYPFFVVPLVMCIDMAVRLGRLAARGAIAEEAKGANGVKRVDDISGTDKVSGSEKAFARAEEAEKASERAEEVERNNEQSVHVKEKTRGSAKRASGLPKREGLRNSKRDRSRDTKLETE